MASFNKILLIGNAGTDPEMRYTPNGNAVTDFRMAVNYRSSGGTETEQRDETEWFTVVCWNRLAEQVNQYLVKGRRAFVEGRFRSRSYVGNDGQTRFVNEVIASRVMFLDRAGEGGGDYPPPAEGGYSRPEPQRQQSQSNDAEDVEELPW
ncbi:MAG: single-stranded DNA-binding protein [Dehalococcoidia bacterium]